MNLTRSVAILSVVFNLALAQAAVAQGGFEWSPSWDMGDYWVVSSATTESTIDPLSGELTNVTAGPPAFTRFRVSHVQQAPGNSGTVILDVRYRLANESGFPVDTYCEIVLDRQQLAVRTLLRHGIQADGTLYTHETRYGYDASTPYPFNSREELESCVPETLAVVMPVMHSGSQPGRYLIESETRVGTLDVAGFKQTLATEGTVASLTLCWTPDCTSGLPGSLRFGITAPWYEVVNSEGTVVNPIVETGRDP